MKSIERTWQEHTNTRSEKGKAILTQKQRHKLKLIKKENVKYDVYNNNHLKISQELNIEHNDYCTTFPQKNINSGPKINNYVNPSPHLQDNHGRGERMYRLQYIHTKEVEKQPISWYFNSHTIVR